MPSKSELPLLAADIGVAERTLRRAVVRGTVRCHRPGPRRVEVDANERDYLRKNWALIAAVAETLRTERNVRLAVIFGSVARGEAREDSDVDVIVALAQERPMFAQYLSARLEQRLGREVDVISIERLRERNPALLSTAIDDGRPVVDRDGLWHRLLAERATIERAGVQARAALHRRAAAAIVELVGER